MGLIARLIILACSAVVARSLGLKVHANAQHTNRHRVACHVDAAQRSSAALHARPALKYSTLLASAAPCLVSGWERGPGLAPTCPHPRLTALALKEGPKFCHFLLTAA